MRDQQPRDIDLTHAKLSSFGDSPGGKKQIGGKLAFIIGSIAVSGILGVSLGFVEPAFVLAIPVGILALVLIISYPIIGLVGFVVLSLLRPSDFYPALGALPMAKAMGGLTALAVIIKNLRSKAFVFHHRQTYLILVLAMTLFLSIPFSFWPSQSIEVSQNFLKTVLFYLIFINVVRDYTALRIVSLTALICSLVLALLTAQSFLTGEFRSTIRQSQMFDANDIALVLVTAIPLAFFWIQRGKLNPMGRLLFVSSIGLLTLGTILTSSRGGLIGLFVVFFIIYSRGKNMFGQMLKFGFIAAVGIAILFVLPQDMTSRYRTLETYHEDESAMHRLYAWQAGASMIIARPLTGVGIGCFGPAYGIRFNPTGESATRWMAPHNSFVQIGAETGAIGLLAFTLLIGYSMSQFRRLSKHDNGHREEIVNASRIYMASLSGFVVCAFFLTQGLSFMLYFLIAASVCLSRMNDEQNARTRIESKTT